MQLKKQQSTKLNSVLIRQLLRSLNESRNAQFSGFTLLEVMVSIIMLTAFMTVTMSALLTATLVKLQANGSTVVANWIEEDIENVRSKAEDKPDGIAYKPFDLLNPNSSDPRCNPGMDSTKGFANELKVNLPAVPSDTPNTSTPNSGTRKVKSKTYNLSRQSTIVATYPYEVLQIAYTATEAGSQTAFTKMYTEVIPNAALKCPKY